MKRLTYLLLCLLMPAMAAAENAPVKYTDAASLTIVNKAQPGGPAFQRIDVARYPELTPTVTRYYRYSTGLAVVFRTDSRNIRARWTTVNKLPGANTTLIAQRGLDLYIRRDGKWVFAGVGVPNKSGTQHEAPPAVRRDRRPRNRNRRRSAVGSRSRPLPPPDCGDRVEHHARHFG